MQSKHFVWISLTAIAFFVLTTATLARAHDTPEPADTLVEKVRQATRQFQDVEAAKEAGYADARVCVSGLDEGAMGVHFVNGELFSDTEPDPELHVLRYWCTNRRTDNCDSLPWSMSLSQRSGTKDTQR